MPDWSHQQRLISDARAAYSAGHRRILLALATGGGKTRVAATLVAGHCAADPSRRVLWLAHLHELLGQARSAIERAGAPMDRVTVESVQTAVRRDLGSYTMVVVDEAHHTAAATYQRVLDRVSPPLLLGLTATPSRLDGTALAPTYTTIVAGPQPRELVRAGVLVPTRVLTRGAASRSLAADPADAYREHAAGTKALVFCSSVAHAETTAQAFSAASIPAASLDGRLSADERARRVAAFGAGEIRVLTNYRLITEGFDVPDCSTVILASNMTSPAMLLQAAGRGKRSAPGKREELLLDLCGVCTADGLDLHPDDDVTYSLEGTPIRAAGEPDVHVRQCEQCGCCARFAEFRASACPECGYVRPGRPDPRVARARLEALDQARRARRADDCARGTRQVQWLVDHCRARRKSRPTYPDFIAFQAVFRRFPFREERAAVESALRGDQ